MNFKEKNSNLPIKELITKIEHESPLIRIGKNSFTPNIKNELINLVRIKKAVKIKVLQNAPVEDIKSFFESIERETSLKANKVKGRTAIFTTTPKNKK